MMDPSLAFSTLALSTLYWALAASNYVLNALNMLPLSVFSYLIPELVVWTIKTNHDEEQVLGHPSGLNLFLANVLTSESRLKRTNIGGLPRHMEWAQVKLMAISLTQNQGVV